MAVIGKTETKFNWFSSNELIPSNSFSQHTAGQLNMQEEEHFSAGKLTTQHTIYKDYKFTVINAGCKLLTWV